MMNIFCLIFFVMPTWFQQWLSDSALSPATVGIEVVRIDSDEAKTNISSTIIYSNDAEKAFVPASIQKLLTTSAALNICGADYKIKTEIYRRGVIDDQGVLHGDIIICGQGDALMGSEKSLFGKDAFRDTLFSVLQKNGIRSISGSIIADARSQQGTGISPDWTWEDMGNYYAAGHYALNYHLNRYSLILDTSHPQTRPTIKGINPEVAGLEIKNYLSNYSSLSDSAYLYGPPLGMQRSLFGAVPHRSSTFTIWGDIPNPPLFLAQSLTQTLGIRIDGPPQCWIEKELNNKNDDKGDWKLLHIYQSESLDYVAKITNEISQNLLAESLLNTLGKCSSLSTELQTYSTALDALHNYCIKQGYDCRGVKIYDGCGLAPTNRITPRFMSQLLVSAYNNNAFYTSIPIAGKEGTVKNFLKGTRLEGKARLKSGTTKLVIAYAGYVEGRDHHTYVVTVIVNNYEGKTAYIRKKIENLILNLIP